ncbi:MAG TPA: hypothetical protein VFF73_22670, partial [Planctomycetota bacterium]|nr:hypothetical protein [Planctomycetota bacterium]
GVVSCICCPGWISIEFLVFQMILTGVLAGLGVGVIEWLAGHGRERGAVLLALVGPSLPVAAGLYADAFRMGSSSIGASRTVVQAFAGNEILAAAAISLGLAGAWVFALPAIAHARGASLRDQVILALAGVLVLVQAFVPAALDARFDDDLTYTALFGGLLPAALFSRLYCARGRVVAARVFSWIGQEPPPARAAAERVPGARVAFALGLSTIAFPWAIGAVPHGWFLEARWAGYVWPFFRGPWRGDSEAAVWLGALTTAWLALEARRGLDRAVPTAEIRASAGIVLAAAAVRIAPVGLYGLDAPEMTLYPPTASVIALAAAALVLVLVASAVSGRASLVRGALIALGSASGALFAGSTVGGGLVPLELFSGRVVHLRILNTWPESPALALGALTGGLAAGLLARLGRAGKVAALVLGLAPIPAVLAAHASGVLPSSPYFWTTDQSPGGPPLAVARAWDLGIGVPELPEEANRWYERAAETGDREALYRLALRLERGVRVPRDRARARRLLERAASLGSPEAASHLEIAAEIAAETSGGK